MLNLVEGSQASECPSSQKDWFDKLDYFSNTLIPDLGNDMVYEHGPKLLPFEKYNEVSSFWSTCKFKASDFIKARFKNLTEHSRYMKITQSSGHAGFTVSDEEYLINSLSLNPKFGSIPRAFFKDNYLPPNWKNIVKDCKKKNIHQVCSVIKNWRFIEFTSTLEDGSGNHKRVIIQIRYKNFIQYLLFFPEHPTHNKNKLIDIISLQTRDLNTGFKLAKARPYFFERHKEGFAKDGGRCISCHPNGLREIIPMQGSSPSIDDLSSIHLLNEEIRSFGKPDWQGVYDHKKLGPPIGDSCIECHSDKAKRSPLTIFTKPSLIRSKIHELEMPFPRLYNLYFKSLKKLQEEENINLKRYIHTFVSKQGALPNMDYRTKYKVREVRKRIQKTLLETKQISYLQYLGIRTIDNTLSMHADYKLKRIFRDHKRKLKKWLMGN